MASPVDAGVIVGIGRGVVTVLLSLMVASFLLAAGFCRVAPAVGLLDRPNDRSLHSSVTPVGVGVVPVSLLALGLVLYEAADFNHYAWPVAGLLIVLCGVGLWDDRWGLPSGLRFVLYLLAGAVLPWYSPWLEGVSWLMLCGTAVAMAWCTNLFNFMDGADGFAVTQALCVSVGLALLSWFAAIPAQPLAQWCAMLAAALAPVLWFNWPPARVFLGDAGAIPIGFFLANLGFLAFEQHSALGWAWCVLMMPFLMDTGCTLVLRVAAGHKPQEAHRDHAYQRLATLAGSPLPVTLGLLALQVGWQFPLAVTVVKQSLFLPALVFLSTIPAFILLVYARLKA